MPANNQPFFAQFAQEIFEVNPASQHLQTFCRDYLTDKRQPDFYVQLTQEDCLYEAQHASDYYGFEVAPNEAAESFALLRKVAELLVTKNILLMHASTIKYCGRAYLFTAPSGTGKTTHIKLWHQQFPGEVEIINDDKPFLRLEEDRVVAYGSPWSGKEHWNTNTQAPVAGILCLERSRDNSVEDMSYSQKWEFLMNQIYRSTDREVLLASMSLLEQLIEQIPVKKLLCNMQPEAALVAQEAMVAATL